MTNDNHDQATYTQFNESVNLQPKELEQWLTTDESKSVGDSDDGESTGHWSGRQIVRIKRTKKADLHSDDYAHMRKVINYIKRHRAQQPAGDVSETRWRYSLMNWGHDPLRES